MKCRYTGPHAEVEVAATGDTCKRGGTVEVPDEVGESLCQQDTWEKAPESKKKEGS